MVHLYELNFDKFLDLVNLDMRLYSAVTEHRWF